MALPDPKTRHPLVIPGDPPTTYEGCVFLNQVVDHPNIEIGDFTYYDDRRKPSDYAAAIAPYLHRDAPERLIIGKFCALAEGVQFVTESANHAMDGVSTYPFGVFDPARFARYGGAVNRGRDTVVGNDVWIGREAMILAGARIGDGAIIGARAVVRGVVPDYAVALGDPAEVARMRFSPAEIETLKAAAWWDWPKEKIEAHLPLIEGGDVAALAEVAKRDR